MKSKTTHDQNRALHYARSRPKYAREVLDFVIEHAGHNTLAVVADIGCGTGLSTSLFHGRADTLIGVEPNPAMRAAAEKAFEKSNIQLLDGSAEQTNLPEQSVTLLAAASCFEWFDPWRAEAEFRRVLAPEGRVLLMWNHRAVIDPVSRAWDRLWLYHMGPRLAPEPGDINDVLVPHFLSPGFHRFRQVKYHSFDLPRLQDLACSSSYAPGRSQERRRRAMQEAITTFHATHSRNELVDLAFETIAYLGVPRFAGRRRARGSGQPQAG